jgi:hypothetical protein
MILNVEPYVGIGPIRFGMTRDDVRRVLGRPSRSFLKGQVEPNDAYEKLHLHVGYDTEGRVETVETFESSAIEWRGVKLFERSYMQLRDMFLEAGASLRFEDDGFESLQHGIGVWAPLDDDDEENVVKSILVFRKGYSS